MELSGSKANDAHSSISTLQSVLDPDTGHLSSSLLSVRVCLQECMKALLCNSQLMDYNVFCLVHDVHIRLSNCTSYYILHIAFLLKIVC